MLGQVLGGGQLRVVDAAEGSPPCYGGRSVEKTAPGGSTWTFGCVATPPCLSPVSLWGVSTTEERHWGVCSRLEALAALGGGRAVSRWVLGGLRSSLLPRPQ